MPFVKGQSGNPKGRRKGSTNKANRVVKRLLENMVSDNAKDIRREFAGLSGKAKIDAFIALMPYIIPKLQATSLDLDLNKLSDEQLDELYNKILSAANQ